MEMSIDLQTLGIGSGSTLFVGAVLRRVYLDWMKARPEVASATAITDQFAILGKQLAQLQADNEQLRTAFHQMDLKIHRQQTKLTRTEMLLRQFVGLIREKNIDVPEFMSAELADLLAPTEDSK